MKAIKEAVHFTSCKQYNKMIIDETNENKHDTNFPKPITPQTFFSLISGRSFLENLKKNHGPIKRYPRILSLRRSQGFLVEEVYHSRPIPGR